MYALKSYASEDTKTVFINGSKKFTIGEHQRDTLIVSDMIGILRTEFLLAGQNNNLL